MNHILVVIPQLSWGYLCMSKSTQQYAHPNDFIGHHMHHNTFKKCGAPYDAVLLPWTQCHMLLVKHQEETESRFFIILVHGIMYITEGLQNMICTYTTTCYPHRSSSLQEFHDAFHSWNMWHLYRSCGNLVTCATTNKMSNLVPNCANSRLPTRLL
jgi:hypothetical protein